MSAITGEKLKSMALPLVGGGSVLLVAGLLYFFLTPVAYRATALVKLERLYRFHAGAPVTMSDADLVAAECQLAASTTVLDQAVEKLDLKNVWGRKFNNGTPMKLEQTRALLIPKTEIYPISQSRVIAFRVTSEDRAQAAPIANELARAYVAIRQTERTAISREKCAALNQRWEEESQKVSAAEAKLYEMYVENTKARETNQTKYYDPVSYQRLQGHRIDMETDYIKKRDDFLGLKAMKRDDVAKLLIVREPGNVVLGGAWRRLGQSRDELRDAEHDHGAGSPEVRRAALIVDEREKKLDEAVAGALLTRGNNVAALKSALDDFTTQLKSASTNVNQATIGFAAYTDARRNFENLKRECDGLQTQLMNLKLSLDAIVPGNVSPEIAEAAQPPVHPAIPNRIVAAAGIAGGFVIALAGVILLLISRWPKPAAPVASS